MKQLQITFLLLSLFFCSLSSLSQTSFPPDNYPSSVNVYADKEVSKNISVEKIEYVGPYTDEKFDGYQFKLSGKTASDINDNKLILVCYILPGNELRTATTCVIPPTKKGKSFTTDIKIKKIIPDFGSDDLMAFMPENFNGFMLTYTNPVRSQLKNGEIGVKIQSSIPDQQDFIMVEVMAEFPGGMSGLMNFLSKNIRYPESALLKDIQGMVIVSFSIDENGKITDPSVLKGVDKDLDAEALRIVSLMPDWHAGALYGKPVKSYFTLPISFRLNPKDLAKKMPKEEKKSLKKAKN